MPREAMPDALGNIRMTARKELAGFFASPAGFLFLAAFLAVTLFVFFWVDTFFARGLADVRPLFQWMPLLLIVLVAALTMRAWAEERRAGTLELLLTSPTAPTELVLGKFFGAMGLVAIALALTLPLPITVALLGPLDWGPVIGGYVAAFALASAYVAIGLWVSSRTDNQIVSLILTALITGAFYLIGTPVLTNLFGIHAGAVLRDLGAGARFDSITRGVLDLRDLYYYLSLTATFLVLNRLAIEKLRWAGNPPQPSHRRWGWIAALLAANALAANFWLDQVRSARVDLTAGQMYTLSDATRTYLSELQEPLLIRGYFSAATHPLLSPLVPQLRDLLQEYAVAGGSKVRVEFVDPHDDPKIEEEAASKYGIRPVPFQTSTKYQASVVNSYFDIIVSYGDQFQTLGFRDLIDVKMRGEGDFDVALKNPEYDITRAIRKVLLSYRGGGSAFATLQRPLEFTGYISEQGLPASLAPARQALDDALAQLRTQAGDKLRVSFKDPSTQAGLAKSLSDEGLQPLITGLLDPRPFWFHMTLSDGRQVERVPLPETADAAGFKRTIEAAVKRFSPGFLKTVAVVTPPDARQEMGRGASFSSLRDALGDSVRWLPTDLSDGRVPASADMLMLLAPEALNAKQVFALDQFLMQGGTVLLATAPADVSLGQGITARPVQSGLQDWLAGIGVSLGKSFVLDTRSGALPIPVERPIGAGMTVREVHLAPYPYIVDVRGAGLDAANPVTASLGQLSVPWVVPVNVDAEKNKARKVTTLLQSSRDSWLSDNANLLPDYRQYPQTGFAVSKERGARPLAVMLEGTFDSAYKGKQSPLLEGAKTSPPAADADKSANASKPGDDKAKPSGFAAVGRVIDQSPASARLIVVGSNAFFNDQTMDLESQALGTSYRKPAEFALNLVDWSLEDQGLLGIRSRSRFARTLDPLSSNAQAAWEYADYALVLAGLFVVWLVLRRRRSVAARRYELLLQEV
ncbi:MAG TPA: Gldg family protein [Burkholderiaceae bacterium]|nr:Gldg family protein [Burkholderiaceae bacterium]